MPVFRFNDGKVTEVSDADPFALTRGMRVKVRDEIGTIMRVLPKHSQIMEPDYAVHFDGDEPGRYVRVRWVDLR